jgi:hypothetical protein
MMRMPNSRQTMPFSTGLCVYVEMGNMLVAALNSLFTHSFHEQRNLAPPPDESEEMSLDEFRRRICKYRVADDLCENIGRRNGMNDDAPWQGSAGSYDEMPSFIHGMMSGGKMPPTGAIFINPESHNAAIFDMINGPMMGQFSRMPPGTHIDEIPDEPTSPQTGDD